MNLFNKKKKGFTIVELVIVIAVIGVLAAILIPTFVGLVNKAHVAADGTLVRELNNAIAMDLATTGEEKHETMYDALQATEKNGFVVQRIKSKTNTNKILWDSVHGVFCYLQEGAEKVEYVPGSVEKGKELSAGDYRLWIISNTVDPTYSTYLYNTTETTFTTDKGLDVGNEKNVTAVTYDHTTGDAQEEVIIRTNSFATTLTINAPADTVNHYGNAAIVNVEKIAGESYHENGTVGRLTVEEGHAVAEANATIFCLIDAGSDTTATAEVKPGAVVYDENGEDKGQEAVVEGTHDDCGAGHHNFGSQLVIDNKVYEVCKSCGYTLVHVVDEITGEDVLTTKITDEGEIVTTPVETYNNSSEVLNENGTVKSNATPSIPAVDASTLNTTCSHEFGEPEVVNPTCYSTGSKTYTCTKCGETMTTTIAKVAHRYYDNPSDTDSMEGKYHEKCLYNALCHNDRGDVNVAKIGETEYRTLRQAIAAVTDNTPTTITMIANDAIYGHVVTKGSKGEDVYTNNCYTIAADRDITIDLNGHTICNYVTADAASQVFQVVGSLTITDSSDVNKDGSGYGVIYNDYARDDENVHVGEWWGTRYNYVTNVITNLGTLTIESGRIYQTAPGSICYAVDNQSTSYDVAVIINGGKLMNHFTAAIRQFCNSTTKNNVVTINGGIIKGYNAIWMQNPTKDKEMKGSLIINGGTFYTEANSYLNGGTVVEASTCIYNTSGSNHASNMYLTINGGEFFENVGWYGSTSHCTITGGIFHGYVDIYSDDSVITGGKFFDVYDAPVSSYVGYYKEDGTFYGGGSSSISWTISDWENNGYTMLNASETGHKYYYLNDYPQYIGRDDGNCGGYTMASWMKSYSYTEISDLTGYYDIISPAYRHLDDLIVSEGYKLQDNGNGTFTVVAAE